MPSKTVKKSSQPTQVTPELVTVTPELATVTPELATVTPELATVTPELVTVTPELATVTPELATKPTQKGGKKKARTPVVAAPELVASNVVAAPELVASNVVAAPELVASNVVAAPELVAAPQTLESSVVKTANKRGGSKSKSVVTSEDSTLEPKKRNARVKTRSPTTQISETPEQTAGTSESLKGKKTILENDAEGDETTDKHTRSFKVKLPNKEEYEGRFTGLTPYQAANKALSKYFRETEQPKEEITFLICESTRKSKKLVYTYIGKRYKLDEPVRYKIQDGREIVKNFKNSLKKVKKSDLSEQSGGKSVPVIAVATE